MHQPGDQAEACKNNGRCGGVVGSGIHDLGQLSAKNGMGQEHSAIGHQRIHPGGVGIGAAGDLIHHADQLHRPTAPLSQSHRHCRGAQKHQSRRPNAHGLAVIQPLVKE